MRDYWSTDLYMPQHRMMKELGMTRDCFFFMWHNFHAYNEEDMDMQTEQNEGEAGKDDDSGNGGILEFIIECNTGSN
eukprot:756645-Ditylum_brightwellii.AAC.1